MDVNCRNKNLPRCACTYEPCPRKGICCDCIAYHNKQGEAPGCLFTKAGEATYDRSMAYLLIDRKNG